MSQEQLWLIDWGVLGAGGSAGPGRATDGSRIQLLPCAKPDPGPPPAEKAWWELWGGHPESVATWKGKEVASGCWPLIQAVPILRASVLRAPGKGN